jgi:hypothetical protein
MTWPKCKTGFHRTGIEWHISKITDRCPFSLSVFRDDTGYYMKFTAAGGIHKFHPHHDFLCASTSHLNEKELELQEYMNLARAKIGTAANTHYVCSGCQGIPMLLSSAQISHLCKKKATSLKVGTPSGIVTGETDDIYKFLEHSGNYYMSLLACGPTDDTMIASKVSHGSCSSFNETHTEIALVIKKL